MTTLGGLLLAGGGSTRFGAPKGEALLDGVRLNEIAFRRLNALCAEVALSGVASGGPEPATRLTDPAGLPSGPLSGILSGLTWAQARDAEFLVVTPCDTPLIRPDDLVQLVELAGSSGADLAILTGPDGPHPLCSVWRPELADRLKAALAERHPPVWKFAADHGAAQLACADPARLVNINTQEDLQAVASSEELFWWRDSA